MSSKFQGTTLIQSLTESIPNLLKATFRSVHSPPSGKPMTFSLPADRNKLIEILSSEIELGSKSLTKWRSSYHNKLNWESLSSEGNAGLAKFLDRLCPPPVPDAGQEINPEKLDQHQIDKQFIQDAILVGNCVISPFVSMRRLGNTTVDSPLADGSSTFVARKDIPSGVFLMSIPSQEALVSNPHATDGASALEAYNQLLESRPYATGNPFGLHIDDIKDSTTYFHSVDGLVTYLALALHQQEVDRFALETDTNGNEVMRRLEEGEDEEGPSFTELYARYLANTVKPPKNLPFINENDIFMATSKKLQGGTGMPPPSCTADALWRYFHLYRGGQPFNLSPMRQLLLGEKYDNHLENEQVASEELRAATGFYADSLNSCLPPLDGSALQEYHWLVSLVLSRRLGPSLLVPLLDKLNHCVPAAAMVAAQSGSGSPSYGKSEYMPTSYYTMATAESFCGLDMLDNLLAGVSSDRLLIPHIHLFSVRPIKKGEALTLSYSDMSPKASPSLSKSSISAGNKGLPVEEENVDDGSAMWRALWGFVPADKPALTESDLVGMASILAERRLLQRKILFPPNSQ